MIRHMIITAAVIAFCATVDGAGYYSISQASPNATSVTATLSPSLTLSPDYLISSSRGTNLIAQDNGSGNGDHGVDKVLSGPYFLRSADPEPIGEMELKFIYGFENGEDNSDEHEFEFVLEWGITDDVEFILEVPFVIGDGGIDGNGDITELGFHTRFWEEDGIHPAFAMRNLVRIPTGYESSGIDYEARGLFTWTLATDHTRLHFNPFLKSVNGDNDEGARDLQWGAAIGFDFVLSDDLLFIVDYQNRAEDKGTSNQHTLEFGADWNIGDGQAIGLQTEFELDGDDEGKDFGFKISYILEIDAS